jgi:predicted nucleotidyltransferase
MKKIEQNKLKELAERYHFSDLYVFGSRAKEIAGRLKGTNEAPFSQDSDVDVGLQPKQGHKLSAMDKVELTLALEELFEAGRVDLILLPEADPFLALDIIRGELLYCADLDRQAEDELYILRRAGDLAHFQRERIEQIIHGGGR